VNENEARMANLNLFKKVTYIKFFSILMDESTDVGKIDDRLFLIQCCNISGTGEKIDSGIEYFTVVIPKSGYAKGLFICLHSALQENIWLKAGLALAFLRA